MQLFLSRDRQAISVDSLLDGTSLVAGDEGKSKKALHTAEGLLGVVVRHFEEAQAAPATAASEAPQTGTAVDMVVMPEVNEEVKNVLSK